LHTFSPVQIIIFVVALITVVKTNTDLSICTSGKYALPHLVRKLPSTTRQSELMLSDETIAAVEAALYEIIKTNSTHARYHLPSDDLVCDLCLMTLKQPWRTWPFVELSGAVLIVVARCGLRLGLISGGRSYTETVSHTELGDLYW